MDSSPKNLWNLYWFVGLFPVFILLISGYIFNETIPCGLISTRYSFLEEIQKTLPAPVLPFLYGFGAALLALLSVCLFCSFFSGFTIIRFIFDTNSYSSHKTWVVILLIAISVILAVLTYVGTFHPHNCVSHDLLRQSFATLPEDRGADDRSGIGDLVSSVNDVFRIGFSAIALTASLAAAASAAVVIRIGMDDDWATDSKIQESQSYLTHVFQLCSIVLVVAFVLMHLYFSLGESYLTAAGHTRVISDLSTKYAVQTGIEQYKNIRFSIELQWAVVASIVLFVLYLPSSLVLFLLTPSQADGRPSASAPWTTLLGRALTVASPILAGALANAAQFWTSVSGS